MRTERTNTASASKQSIIKTTTASTEGGTWARWQSQAECRRLLQKKQFVTPTFHQIRLWQNKRVIAPAPQLQHCSTMQILQRSSRKRGRAAWIIVEDIFTVTHFKVKFKPLKGTEHNTGLRKTNENGKSLKTWCDARLAKNLFVFLFSVYSCLKLKWFCDGIENYNLQSLGKYLWKKNLNFWSFSQNINQNNQQQQKTSALTKNKQLPTILLLLKDKKLHKLFEERFYRFFYINIIIFGIKIHNQNQEVKLKRHLFQSLVFEKGCQY